MFLTRATRNTIFGASMPDKPIPSWDALLSSAAHLQKIVPGAVLVGGTAAATYAHHRVSVWPIRYLSILTIPTLPNTSI